MGSLYPRAQYSPIHGGQEPPEAGITGSHVAWDTSAENQTWVLQEALLTTEPSLRARHIPFEVSIQTSSLFFCLTVCFLLSCGHGGTFLMGPHSESSPLSPLLKQKGWVVLDPGSSWFSRTVLAFTVACLLDQLCSVPSREAGPCLALG